MSLAVVYIELFVLIIGIIILVALFAFRVPPFNKPYQFRDPRTWESVANNQSWLAPVFDYSPYDRDIPDFSVKATYCGTTADPIDPTRCISSFTQYQEQVTTAPVHC